MKDSDDILQYGAYVCLHGFDRDTSIHYKVLNFCVFLLSISITTTSALSFLNLCYVTP